MCVYVGMSRFDSESLVPPVQGIEENGTNKVTFYSYVDYHQPVNPTNPRAEEWIKEQPGSWLSEVGKGESGRILYEKLNSNESVVAFLDATDGEEETDARANAARLGR